MLHKNLEKVTVLHLKIMFLILIVIVVCWFYGKEGVLVYRMQFYLGKVFSDNIY